MSVPATFKYDLPNSAITPVQEGRTTVAYPFLPNGSIGPKVYTRRLLQQEAYYVPATMGLERDSVWPGGDPQAYLISETSPEHTGIGDMLRFSRTYARIPATQTVYGTRRIQRPILHGIVSGSSYAVSFDNGATSHVWTSRKAVTRIFAVPATSVVAALPSSNVTFIEGGRTLNIAANSTAAAFVSGFNTTLTGLTQVAAYVGTGYASLVWTGVMTSITPPSGANIVQQSSWNVVLYSNSVITTPAVTSINAVAHGASVGDKVAFWNGNALTDQAVVVAVGGADYFSVQPADLKSTGTPVTHCAFSSAAAGRYVTGDVSVSTKEVTTFYLPLVTTGITTPADISLAAPKIDPVSWLGEIVAYIAGGSLTSYYSAIEGSKLDRWLDGPIYTQTVTSAQMSDALDTVPVGA